MAIPDSEPLEGETGSTGPDQPGEPSRANAEPGDEYFSSGSFSPVTVQLGDEGEQEPECEDPEERSPRAQDSTGEDSPQVIVQFGEDSGAVSSDDRPGRRNRTSPVGRPRCSCCFILTRRVSPGWS